MTSYQHTSAQLAALAAMREDALPTPEAAAARRFALQVHVVLELTDGLEGYYQDFPEDIDGLTVEQLKVKIEGDFASFVANEIDNCKEYGVQVAAIVAEVTEVSA